MLPIPAELILEKLVFWSAPFLRVSAMLLIAPVFSASGVPVRFRVLLAVLIAALAAPIIPTPPTTDLFSANGLLMAIREVGIGFAIGFVLQLVFGAVVYAGQAVSMTMGLGFAMAVDPQNGVQVPVLSQMYVILATLLFLSLNGHLILIATVIDSYQILPPNLSGIPVSSLGEVAALGSKVFASGISLALPAMAAMLMVNVTFGVITRTAPQLNIFAVGFPMTLMGGFFVLFINMPNLIAALSQFLDQALMQVPAVFM